MAQPEIDLSTWATPLTLGALGANNAQRALGRLATAQSGNPHCLLKRSGSLWCNFAPEQSAELYVNTALGEHARQVEAGELFACAVSDDGRVWCEGTNGLGQLGQGTVGGGGAGFVQGLTKVAAVAVGLSRTCALRLDGTIWCWGQNMRGDAIDAAPVQLTACVDQQRAPRPVELLAPSDPAWRLAEAGRARAQAVCACNPGSEGNRDYAACVERENRSPAATCLAALIPGEKEAWECLTNQRWEEALCFARCQPPSVSGPCFRDGCENVRLIGVRRHCFHELRCAPDAAPLSMLSICDGVRDCADGSDERNCSPAQGYFECIDGSTIEVIQVCDQHVDCADGSDESRCL